MNITALPGGFFAVTEQRPTGFGPTIWVGELRDRKGKPVREPGSTGRRHLCYPLTVGPTEPGVIAAVSRRAQQLARPA